MRLVLPSFLAFAASVAAVGSAIVNNNSSSPIYVWSVGSSVGPRWAIGPGDLYLEDLHRDEKTGGIALKITKSADGLYNGEAQQVFAYNLDGAQVWYDLSSLFGEPFKGLRVEVTSDTGGPIVWSNGTNPGGSQVKVTSSYENIWLTIYGAPVA